MARFIGIGFGVICLHAAALWLVSMDSRETPPLTQAFVMLAAPPPLPPTPIMAPNATKPARPTAHAEQASRVKKPATDLEIPAAKPAAPTPAQDAPATAANTRSTPAMAAAPANFSMQTSDRNETPAETGPGAGGDKTTASIRLPSSNADYLNNPAPVYPALSQRLGEQGKVVIRVLIGKDGTAHQADIHQSSGFERLDQAALRAVMSWRYVPGQRGGVAQDMWFNVPVNFSLN